MSWFTPAKNLSAGAEEVLRELAESGSSESAGVADILNTIASNDAESATDDFLVTCAQQIIEAAQAFIDRVHGDSVAPGR